MSVHNKRCKQYFVLLSMQWIQFYLYRSIDLYVILWLSLWQWRQVGLKKASEQVVVPAVHFSGLGAFSPGGEGPRTQVAGLRRAEWSRAVLCGVEALHGAGEPDESLETLNTATAVVQELVLRHRPAAEWNGLKVIILLE